MWQSVTIGVETQFPFIDFQDALVFLRGQSKLVRPLLCYASFQALEICFLSSLDQSPKLDKVKRHDAQDQAVWHRYTLKVEVPGCLLYILCTLHLAIWVPNRP